MNGIIKLRGFLDDLVAPEPRALDEASRAEDLHLDALSELDVILSTHCDLPVSQSAGQRLIVSRPGLLTQAAEGLKNQSLRVTYNDNVPLS